MNGHERRRNNKIEVIKNTAFTLFNTYGIKKVSIDEIADKANVSKVTIYKYFESKEGLYREVVKMIFANMVRKVEETFHCKEDFLSKLKCVLSSKEQSQSILNGKFIEEVRRMDAECEQYMVDIYDRQVKKLMFDFFNEGKAAGYINRNISNDILYAYTEIFRAGLNAKYTYFESLMNHKQSYDKLVDLYFFGLINKRE